MKLKIVKKADAKPTMRFKIMGNVFVEIYNDNKGWFYKIDIPGFTDFVSKERFDSQDKASLAGRTHADKFVKKIRASF